MLLLEVSISFHLSLLTLPSGSFSHLSPPPIQVLASSLRAEGWSQATSAVTLGSDPTSVFCRAPDKLWRRVSSQVSLHRSLSQDRVFKLLGLALNPYCPRGWVERSVVLCRLLQC